MEKCGRICNTYRMDFFAHIIYASIIISASLAEVKQKKTDRILTMHCYGISQVQVIEPIKSSLKFVEQMEKSK